MRGSRSMTLGLVLVAVFTLAFGFGRSSTRHNQLATRVDSLAVTLTQIVDRLGTPAGNQAPDSASVAVTGAVLGASDAPVTLVEFTDFECPFCRSFHQETLPILVEEYVRSGKVRFVLRDNPLPFHPNALPAARAARCVREQDGDAYWRFVEAAMMGKAAMTREVLAQFASSAGADPVAFAACAESSRHDELIKADASDALQAGLGGTPAFILGPTAGDSVTGRVINGAYPIETFRSAIEEALNAGNLDSKGG